MYIILLASIEYRYDCQGPRCVCQLLINISHLQCNQELTIDMVLWDLCRFIFAAYLDVRCFLFGIADPLRYQWWLCDSNVLSCRLNWQICSCSRYRRSTISTTAYATAGTRCTCAASAAGRTYTTRLANDTVFGGHFLINIT